MLSIEQDCFVGIVQEGDAEHKFVFPFNHLEVDELGILLKNGTGIRFQLLSDYERSLLIFDKNFDDYICESIVGRMIH